MSEPRLYLYRKAGREVWDAEMWLPDGRRRAWRTGIADRDVAEAAARARLESLVASTTAAVSPAVDASAAAADDHVGVTTAQLANAVEAAEDAGTEPMTESGISASVGEKAEQTEPVVEVQARGATWSEQFDRWFFGELASLWRAGA
jgi:hypothetical protein